MKNRKVAAMPGGRSGKARPALCLLAGIAAAGAVLSSAPAAPVTVRFNGQPLDQSGEGLRLFPGRPQRVDVEAHPGATGRLAVSVNKRLPDGSRETLRAVLSPGAAESFPIGPLTAPPAFAFEHGVVYQREYGLDIDVRFEGADEAVFSASYGQFRSVAENNFSLHWSQIGPLTAGEIRWMPGTSERLPFNPVYGVEPVIGLRLDEKVLADNDAVEVLVRLTPGAELAGLEGDLVAEDSGGKVLFRRATQLKEGTEWKRIALDVRGWPAGDVRIAFHPILEGTLWPEGPAVAYRRRPEEPGRVRVSPLAPWTLERDPSRPDIEVTDFSAVPEDWIGAAGWGGWSLRGGPGKAALSFPAGTEARPLVLDPGLTGWYAVFARATGDGCLLRVGDDPLLRPLRDTRSAVFITAADLTGGGLTLFPFDPFNEPRSGLAALRLVPVAAASVRAFRRETGHPPTPLYGVNDWCEYFHGPARLHPDQIETILEGQAELGLRSIGWSVGRSWLEYHTRLPDRNLFPVVPLEVAAKTNPRAMDYYGRATMIRSSCPLAAALSNRDRLGIELFPWLSMNRHYGEGSGGGLFASEWFLRHPQWRRWRKNAQQPDAGEVSFFFEEVRRERVEILLETAALGADGLLVGTTRQVPLLLYHPAMVEAYRQATGVNPLEIDAGDGEPYLDWIRWRADHFTKTLRLLRRELAPLEAARGRRIPVSARIPSLGLFYNLAQGLDVEQWLREGLVDRLQLNPLEDSGGRGSHDVRPYLELGRAYGIPVIGGIGATWMRDQGHAAALRRALGLIRAGVDGIEIYETELLARAVPHRWILPLFGHARRIEEMLRDSNLEACFPPTPSRVLFGHDNHSRWAPHGYSVHGQGRNTL